MKSFEEIQRICGEDLENSVIPFWTKNSPDREFGGTFSCLDKDGSIYDSKKYVWLLGRSVWMYCKLYNEYQNRPEFLEIARLGLDFIEKHAVDSQGRYYFSLTRDGKPYFYQRKVYGAVFCMLAYLEYFKTGGEQRYLDLSLELFGRIQAWIKDPSLLGRPVYSGLPKTSSLADVMVLASMAIELAQVERKQEYLDIMADSLANIDLHYDKDRSILIENAPLKGGNISDQSDQPEGRFFNPGHSIEVAWFMLHLLEFMPDNDKTGMALDIIKGSMDFGWDKEFGGIYYFMDIEGKPTLQLESNMKLWWPHTEAIYALALAYKKTGHGEWLRRLNEVVDYTYKHFADPVNGGWFGYCDRKGELTHSSKGGSYKGFFHVPRSLLMTSSL